MTTGESRVSRVEGRAVPVRGNDIDTDRIIPARFLRCVTFEGLGDHAFEDDRKNSAEPHPFDRPEFEGSSILLVGRNFGCGSSREHAPQSLMRWGIRAFVGESFAEIFFGNCVALGIPCLTLVSADLEELMDRVEGDPGTAIVVDLENRSVSRADWTRSAGMPDGIRSAFLTGTWDSTGQLMDSPEETRRVAESLPYVSGWS